MEIRLFIKRLREEGVVLKLNNDQLEIVLLNNHIEDETLALLKKHKQDIINYFSGILSKNNSNEIKPVKIAESYPVTASQNRFWVVSQFEDTSLAYNMPVALQLKGELEISKFEESFRFLINRHEVLRTSFKLNEAGQLNQFITSMDDLDFSLNYVDLSLSSENEATVAEYLVKENSIAFNLEKAPLIRVSLIKSGEQEYVFFMTMHHIIGDGWSSELLVKEIVTIYNSLIHSKEANLPELRIQYKDYAGWLNEELQQERYKASEAYWLNQFSGSLPVIELAGIKKRPLVKTYNGNFLNHQFSNAFLEKVTAFSKKHDVTLFMTLMSGINTLLSRYTGQQDIIIGSPIAGREHPDLENQVGLYLNTLALRTQIDKNFNFLDLLRHEKEVILGAYEHQSYPFDELIDKLKLKRDSSRSALFDIMVVLQSQSKLNNFKGGKLQGLEFKEYQLNDKTSKFDFIFSFTETDTLSMEINYNTDIYDSLFVEKMAVHFEQLVSRMIDEPETKIQQIDYLGAEEKQHILVDFNATNVEYPRDKTIVALFEEQVQKTPQHIALVFEDREITYKELNEEANELGHYLRNKYQIQPDDFIGIKLERSEKLIISILGILKSGGAYVPIDANYPQDRINYIEEDTRCKIIIDDNQWNIFKSSQVESKKENLALVNSPNDLAYVIYTSGTTGNPKGVMVEHKSVVRLVKPGSYFPLNESKILLSTGAISFDATIIEYFGTLLNGSKLIIAKQDNLLDTTILKSIISKNKVNCLWMTASWFSQVADSNISVFETIEYLIAGGDVVSPVHTKKLFDTYKDIKITNGYGPTENTTFSLTHEISYNDSISIPIGKPIENSTAYILDEHLQPVPVGIAGTLYVGGDGLSRGYLNKPELTSEKFIENPFLSGKKIYNTGDLGKWLPNGDVIYLGRNDDQVKIRGHRIELGEIETAISKYSELVFQVIVEAKEIKEAKVLAAYYVASENIDKAELRSYLQGVLPEFMIPNYYIQLENMPLTPNGKVDKKALPDISGEDIIKKEYVAPTNEIEEQLVVIWQEVLKVEQIGITDNFFELGGHSLVAAQVINQIQKQLNKKVSFKDFFSNLTIEELSEKLTQTGYVSIPKAPLGESYPLTASQNRFWLLSQLDGGSLAYNIPIALELAGVLDKDKFEASFQKVIERHEILRTSFKADESGLVRQHILPVESVDFRLIREDFSLVNSQQEAISDYLEEQSSFAFNLEKAPLLRGGLVTLEEQKHLFFLSMHHIIGDGWSLELLVSEVVKIYNGLTQGLETDLPVLNIQYKDYAVWLSSEPEQEKHVKSKEFWLSQFSGELPVLDLPSFKKRPLLQSYKGESINYTFSEVFSDQLKTYSKNQDATLFMTLMAGVKTLLYRYTGQNDIIIGTPIAGREHPDLENQAGLYLNTLAIRTQFKDKSSFLEIVKQEKQTLLEAYEHQNYPFDELIGNLNLKRDMSRSALFDVMVVLQNQGQLKNLVSEEELTGLQIKNYEFKSGTSQFDVSFVFIEKEEGLSLTIQYNTDLYDAVLIQRMFAHLELLMTQAIEQTSVVVEELSYITNEEKLQVTQVFNDTIAEYSKDKTIIDLFEEQAAKTPNKIAVVFNDIEISYKQLNEQANELAHYLRDNYQIEPNDFVGIKLDRSEKIIISILGILKAGAAYVPIDLTYPEDRIKYIEKDTSCKVIIDSTEWNAFKSFKTDDKKANISPVNSPEDLAYVIYTSGTTGNPKGVMVEHRNATALIDWSKDEYAQSTFDMVYAVTSYCFDLSVYEFFFTLTTGKTLRILKNALEIANYSDNDENILLNTVPSVVRKLLEDKISFKNIKVLNMAGEILPTDIIEQLPLESIEVRNLYGPSEDTTYSTCYLITSKTNKTISIGRPISNTQAWILDESLSPVPMGITGKIYLSGDGVTRGYLNKPELTTEKFIDNPFIEGGRMYDTGDLAYWMPDGNIEFIGRKDHQVKIRGYRIELGEIETAISKYSDQTKQVILEAKEIKGTQALVAYYVATEIIDKAKLRTYLQSVLPEFMVPNYYVQLENMPLTSNGKIDRKALPNVLENDIMRKEYVAPTNETEEKLVQIWEEVLMIEKVGVTDNFFEIGGHSIKAMKLISKIKEEFNVSLKISEIFNNPTLFLQSEYIASLEVNSNDTIPVFPEESSYPVSFAQRRLLPLSQINESSVAYNMPTTLVLKEDYDPDLFMEALYAVVDRHEILRTVFQQDEDGNFTQCVKSLDELGLKVSFQDFSQSKDTYSEVFDYVYKDSFLPFDVKNGPLVRFALLKTDKSTFVFYSNLHHIIFDGWSYKVLKRDVMAFYNAFKNDEKPKLPELRIQYKDFTIWQLKTVKGDDYQKQKTFWQNQFQGEIPQLNLNFANNRPNLKTYNGSTLMYLIDGEAFENFKELTKTTGTTPFLNLLGIASMVLYRNSLQKEIIIGSPVSGRIHTDLDDQVGFYVNTLPLKIILEEEKTYQHFIETIKETVLACFDNQSYPFDVLVEDLNQGRDLSRSPLFDVMLTLNEYEEINGNFIKSGEYTEDEATSKYDLLFEFDLFENNLQCRSTYNTNLFKKEAIEKLIADFKKLLENVSHDQSLTLDECLNSIISEKELCEQEDFLNAIFSEISEDF